jgi:hypothetical protein
MDFNQHAFYLLSEIFISLIGGVLLLAIWMAVQRQFKNQLIHEVAVKRVDKGLLYLSLSLFVWSFSGTITFFNLEFTINNWLILLSQNVFSIFNSLFLILTLFFLDHAPDYLYNNKKNVGKVIISLVALSLLSFVLALTFNNTVSAYDIRYSAIPDLVLSAILSWFLGTALFKTFKARQMIVVSYVALCSIVLIFISQIPQVFHIESYLFYTDLIKIIAKTGLISIFLVLGTSWVIELSQTPNVTYMKINFTDWNQLTISIPTKGIINQTIEFGNKTTQFNNLLKFAIRRKFADEKSMCISVFNGGEIQSQTYLSRIVDNVNEILELDSESKIKRNDLFTFIGQGKYRLRFIPKYITIDAALLNEFIHNTSNTDYLGFVEND